MLNQVIKDKVETAAAAYEGIYDSSYSLLNLMKSNQLSVPGILENNIMTVFQYKLEEIFEDNSQLIH